jgi:hypothetical protein
MTLKQKSYASQLRFLEAEALDNGNVEAAQDAAIIRSIFNNAHALDSELYTGGESDLLGVLLYGGE